MPAHPMRLRDWLARLCLGAWLAVPAVADAQPELQLPPPVPLPGNGKERSPVSPAGVTVRECIAVGLANQPTLKAYRASLASTETSYRELCETKGIASWFAPDLEVRKAQALLGIDAARARLAQAEWDTVYAITRNYWSVVYAQEQRRAADSVLAGLRGYLDLVKDLIEVGATRELNQASVDKLSITIGQIEIKRIQAASGVERAKAALREAMGLGQRYPLEVAEQRLPRFSLDVDEAYVVGTAMGRRGEIAQARLAAEIFRLEIAAQGETRRRRIVRTIASGADIHSQDIPQRDFGDDYRPGGIGVEMPVNVYGDRGGRVEKVAHLSVRAEAVFETARNTIELESANAYLRWLEAQRQVESSLEAYKAAFDLVERNRENLELRDFKERDVLTNDVLVGQALGARNESLYAAILALAQLERVTAGGIRINWPEPMPPEKLPTNGDGHGGDTSLRSR